jgi:hypothetical protein
VEDALTEALGRLELIGDYVVCQKGDIARLSAAVESAVPKLVYPHSGYAHPASPDFFRVAVLARPVDRWRRLKFISLAERFESAVCFEFEEVDIEGDAALPAQTDGVLVCNGDRPAGWSGATVTVCFTDSRAPSSSAGLRQSPGAESEVTVDLGTGNGVGVALAALYGRARGSTSFAFSDEGRELHVTEPAPNGLNAFGRSEASRTIRIIVECWQLVGGIWGPIFPHATEISLLYDPCLIPRRFAGLRFSRVEVRGLTSPADTMKALTNNSTAFDNTPWRATFPLGERVESVLSGRAPSSIFQAGGFPPAQCLEWPGLRDCGPCAFLGAKFRRFDFTAGLKRLGEYAFADSLLETVELPDNVTELGLHCFQDCKRLQIVKLGAGILSIPELAFTGCTSLYQFTGSNLHGIGPSAFGQTYSLGKFNFCCLASGAHIGQFAFGMSGITSVALNHEPVLGEGAFLGCEQLQKVVINQTNIPGELFKSCRSLERVWLPVGVNCIGKLAFCDCYALRSIDLSTLSPEGRIEDHAFTGSGLVEVTFPTKLESIGDGAFGFCHFLTSVRLPQQLGRLGNDAFKQCLSLRRFSCGDIREWPTNPEYQFIRGQLHRLELTGNDFASLPAKVMTAWLARGACVVSASFAGRRFGSFDIISE